MTSWINQHLVETKELIQQWRINRTVSALATIDHVEVGSSHIILGLDIGWENLTEKPIVIVEIQVAIFRRNAHDVLVRLLPLERFGRKDIQRNLIKMPLHQFTLRSHLVHTEHIRFISHGHLNLTPGTYIADIQIRDTHHTSYTRRTKLVLENKMKYRLSEEWQEVGLGV